MEVTLEMAKITKNYAKYTFGTRGDPVIAQVLFSKKGLLKGEEFPGEIEVDIDSDEFFEEDESEIDEPEIPKKKPKKGNKSRK